MSEWLATKARVMRSLWWSSLSLVVACSGVAVVDGSDTAGGDGGDGGGAAGGGAVGGGAVGGGAPVVDCDGIEEAYQAALQQAGSCDPQINAVQCTEQVDMQLLCPCAGLFVNPASAGFEQLQDVAADWQAAGCPLEDIGCPDIGCVQPTMGSCVAQPPGSSPAGVCVSS